jgi:hypothetical protein
VLMVTPKSLEWPIDRLAGTRARAGLTLSSVPVSSHWNSMTKSIESSDGGGTCTPPGLDERGIKMSQIPEISQSPESHVTGITGITRTPTITVMKLEPRPALTRKE